MTEDSAQLAEQATAARTMARRVGRVAAVVLLAFLPACSPSGNAQSSPAPPSLISSPPTSTAVLVPIDSAWLQVTVAMEDSMVPLLDLAADRATEPRLGQLAIDVRAGIMTVLPKLREFSDQGGLPRENPHRGHQMPGMVTADQLTRAAALHGDEFDRLLRDCLRAYLERQLRLARIMRDADGDESIRTVAGHIEQSTDAHLDLLNQVEAGPE